MIPIIVGYKLSERPDAREGLQLDDFGLKTEKGNAERREKFVIELPSILPQLKVTGHIERIVAEDASTERHFDSADPVYEYGKDPAKGPISPAHAFAYWLMDKHAEHFNVELHGSNYVVFFGFDLKPVFRVLGPEANVDANFHIPLGLWYSNSECLDPYEMLTEPDYRLQLPLPKVLRRVGLRLPDDYRLHADAKSDCALAAELVYRFKLVGPDDHKALAAALKAHFHKSKDEASESPVTPAVAEKPKKKSRKDAKQPT